MSKEKEFDVRKYFEGIVRDNKRREASWTDEIAEYLGKLPTHKVTAIRKLCLEILQRREK